MPRLPSAQQPTISELTRRDIFDALAVEGTAWFGRLEETAFLQRVWDLNDMASTDSRFQDAEGDIWQHRIRNPGDWEDDWIFTDGRFDLLRCDDERFLRFLCEMVHPVVRSNRDEVGELVALFNKRLAGDGWALVAAEQMSGRPVFQGRRRKGAKDPTTALRLPEYQRLRDPEIFEEHMRRIDAG